MCYNVQYLTKRAEKYAERFGLAEEAINSIKKIVGPKHQSSAFEYPLVPIVSVENTNDLQLFNWGIIPKWVKDWKQAQTIRNKTANARAETMLELPSFKNSVQTQRCVFILDGFYEHHHLGGKAFPYHISLANEAPFAVAGLYEKWEGFDNEGKQIAMKTACIITTKANETMAQIHNNPKLKEPRMPAILDSEKQKIWLQNDLFISQSFVNQFFEPIQSDLIKAITVKPLKGPQSPGNVEEAHKFYYNPVIGLPFY